MQDDRVRAELDARRRQGAMLKRLGGIQRITSMLAGDDVQQAVRTIVEQAAAPRRASTAEMEAHAKLAKQLAGASDADWARTVEVMLPRIAPTVISALRIIERRPYQDGFTRHPFRAPRSTTSLAATRLRWLASVGLLLGDYDADIVWVAEHAAHLAGWSGGVDLGWLLAGAIDRDDDAGRRVFEILAAICRGERADAEMGRHVTQALMSCGRPDAWELVEKLLLSAQREEGLRQAILESVDESHPEAFRRMLRVIREHGLARFSSVVRAADTWFAFHWDGASGVKIEAIVERVLRFMDDRGTCLAALDDGDAETVYLALWSLAFSDVEAAMPHAVARLSAPAVDVRFVATHFLAQTHWPTALAPLLGPLADDDLRVAARALSMVVTDRTERIDGERLFAQLEALMSRLPKRSQTLKAIVWPWWVQKIEREVVAAAMAANASAVSAERMLPYVPDLPPHARAQFIRDAAGLRPRRDNLLGAPPKQRALTRDERMLALHLLGDASPIVRRSAVEALATVPLEREEVDRLVELLDRNASDLRSHAITRLRSLPGAEMRAVANRLAGDADENRRKAGEEMLRDAAAPEKPTTDDALGLVDRSSLRRWPVPQPQRITLETTAAAKCLESLAELLTAHAETEITMPSGTVQLLVQAVAWQSGPGNREDLDSGGNLPLADTWRTWLRERPDALRDTDSLEMLRTLLANYDSKHWKSEALERLGAIGQYKRGLGLLRGVLLWCVAWEPPPKGGEFLLDGLEDALASFTKHDFEEMRAAAARPAHMPVVPWGTRKADWDAKLAIAEMWFRRFRWWRGLFPKTIEPRQAARLFGLLRAFEASANGPGRLTIDLDDFVGAYDAGATDVAELADLLAGRWSKRGHIALLRVASTRRPPRAIAARPKLVAAVDRCRRRIVEVETQRGDQPTAASPLAMELRWTGGLDTLARALPALGKTHFARNFGWSTSGDSRQETLSHLVVRSSPRDEDTPEAFAKWARSSRLSDTRLVELAVYAPQWAAHVNHLLGWPGLEDGVWWVQAHTKDERAWQVRDLKEAWAGEVSERTPLSSDELTEGAVDVAWFGKAYAGLGLDRWKSLDAAAKYAASSAGHTRAQLFARAMTGLVTRNDLLSRIDEKRHQDSVRALGLLPLAEGKERTADLIERFTRLEAFRRESRKFGSLRQQSEKRAVEIGLANLARTAGFRDPQRLRWAMEQEATADLARGPLRLTRGDVTLTLSIDSDGVPALEIRRNEKTLKSLPASLRTDDDVQELKDRLQELKHQRSRVCGALEEAMCRGDRVTAAELRMLLTHPILAPALTRLVFVGDGIAGYPGDDGRALVDHAGTRHVLGNAEAVHVAHPHDLFTRGDWSEWQRECFRAERVQPFKQVFRELYSITETERGTDRTRRYAGHQVQPRQAMALLGGRNWVAKPEEGVSRTFHDEGITARLGFHEAFFTPADIEGLTLEEVVFTKKGHWAELPLDQIPARVFSETMRDVDLVVSVAHRGGVDPEATASTVEMRASLVGETCALLGLANVELKAQHAIVRGALATYSVHLGSAGVMVMPSTAIPIVAVHSQHRGRIFLPFADDDPRTAEVLSKVLMLARDQSIRDPNILQWIRAAG